MLFTTIQQLKEHAGGAVNMNMPLAELAVAYRRACRQHIYRYVGRDFLAELHDAVAEGDVDEEQEKAIRWLREPLALLTLYQYSFIAQIQFSSEGMVRHEGEMVKGAYKYQVNDYRAWTHSTGLGALDNALRMLDINAADYPIWAQGKGAAYHRAVLIRTNEDLIQVHNQATDRPAYEALRPIMADLQTFVIESLIGPTLLAELLDALTDPDTATDHQLELIRRLQRSLAAFTVYEGMQRNIVQLQAGRIVQIEQLEPQSQERSGTAAINALNISALQNKEFAERHLSYVREYLDAHADQFPAYTDYLELSQPDPDVDYPSAPKRKTGGKVVRL